MSHTPFEARPDESPSASPSGGPLGVQGRGIKTPTPTRIEPYSPTELLLNWSSLESFAVPYTELRFQCPCASCIDEHTGQRLIQRASVRPDVRPLAVSPVGRYALQFNWSDGHQTGIYHYDRIYQTCLKNGRRLA